MLMQHVNIVLKTQQSFTFWFNTCRGDLCEAAARLCQDVLVKLFPVLTKQKICFKTKF